MSKTKYTLVRTIYVSLIINLILTGIFSFISGIFKLITNAESGWLLLYFFVILFTIAILYSAYDNKMKKYQYDRLVNNTLEKGCDRFLTITNKRNIQSILLDLGYNKMNAFTYAKMKKSIYMKKVYVVYIREFETFHKFKWTEKNLDSIYREFKLPTMAQLMKNPKKRGTFKIYELEIELLDTFEESHIKSYIETNSSYILYKFKTTGIVYSNSNSTFYYMNKPGGNRPMMKIMNKIFDS